MKKINLFIYVVVTLSSFAICMERNHVAQTIDQKQIIQDKNLLHDLAWELLKGYRNFNLRDADDRYTKEFKGAQTEMVRYYNNLKKQINNGAINYEKASQRLIAFDDVMKKDLQSSLRHGAQMRELSAKKREFTAIANKKMQELKDKLSNVIDNKLITNEKAKSLGSYLKIAEDSFKEIINNVKESQDLENIFYENLDFVVPDFNKDLQKAINENKNR